jgi:hypothetical protein
LIISNIDTITDTPSPSEARRLLSASSRRTGPFAPAPATSHATASGIVYFKYFAWPHIDITT